jgi:hypothetical protein
MIDAIEILCIKTIVFFNTQYKEQALNDLKQEQWFLIIKLKSRYENRVPDGSNYTYLQSNKQNHTIS